MLGLIRKRVTQSSGGTTERGLVDVVNLAPDSPAPARQLHYSADSETENVYEVEYTNGILPLIASRYQRLTFWLNERGLIRLQQSVFSKWDVPLRIFGPSDEGGFGSNIIEVVKFRKSASPQDAPKVFIVKANGRVGTSIYDFAPLTFPNSKFSDGSEQTGGPWGSPTARLETDDRVWLNGRINVNGASLSPNEIIGRVPFVPTANRMVMIGNSTGGVAHCIISSSNGDIINQRSAASGAGAIYLDDVSYRI